MNHLSKEYEPFTKINLTSERGVGGDIDKVVSPLNSNRTRISPFAGGGPPANAARATSHS